MGLIVVLSCHRLRRNRVEPGMVFPARVEPSFKNDRIA